MVLKLTYNYRMKSIRIIHKLMQDRLKYDLRSNIYLSWLSLKFQCHVNLPSPEDNDEFD